MQSANKLDFAQDNQSIKHQVLSTGQTKKRYLLNKSLPSSPINNSNYLTTVQTYASPQIKIISNNHSFINNQKHPYSKKAGSQSTSKRSIFYLKSYQAETPMSQSNIHDEKEFKESNQIDGFLKLKPNQDLQIDNKQIMKPRQDRNGSIINRSVIGSSEVFQEISLQKSRKNSVAQIGSGQQLRDMGFMNLFDGSSSSYLGAGYRGGDLTSSQDKRGNFSGVGSPKMPDYLSVSNRHKSPIGQTPSKMQNRTNNQKEIISPDPISIAAVISRGQIVSSPLNHQRKKGVQTAKKGEKPIEMLELNDQDLEILYDNINRQRIQDQNMSIFQNRRMSLNYRLNVTREERHLQQFNKYQNYWQESAKRMAEQRSQLNLETNPNYRKNLLQHKKDITILERLDYHNEMQNDKALLEAAFPLGVQSSSQSFIQNLRNHSPSKQIDELGNSIDHGSYEDQKSRLVIKTYGIGPFAKRIYHKVPQQTVNQIITKTKPYKLSFSYNNSPIRILDNNTSPKSLLQSIVNDQSRILKSFKDCPEVQKQIFLNKDQLDQAKFSNQTYDQISELYLEGVNKLQQEFQAAKSINENSRKIMLLPNTLASSFIKPSQQIHDEFSPKTNNSNLQSRTQKRSSSNLVNGAIKVGDFTTKNSSKSPMKKLSNKQIQQNINFSSQAQKQSQSPQKQPRKSSVRISSIIQTPQNPLPKQNEEILAKAKLERHQIYF